jgi:hypothetical protein
VRSGFEISGLGEVVSIGVLTDTVRRDVVAEVLADNVRPGARVRSLPDIVVVYFVIAMSLFFADGYQEVIRKMVESLRSTRFWNRTWVVPTASALCQARGRVSAAVMRTVFERTAAPLATASTPGCWLGERRLMAFDGTVLDLPDSISNEEAFGRRRGTKEAPFPQVQLVGLVEIGTHAVIAAELGRAFDGERALAAALRGRLEPGMLVLFDRGFYSFDFYRNMMTTGADLLFRVPSTVRLPVRETLHDGSYLSEISTERSRRLKPRYPSEIYGIADATAIPVRVIEYMVTDRGHPGERETICLITTILDPSDTTAAELAHTYAQRWEIELVFNELKTRLLAARPTLRSQSPELVKQEIWGILLAHHALRSLMVTSARQRRADPDLMSFTHAVNVVRRTMITGVDFPPPHRAGIPGSRAARDR